LEYTAESDKNGLYLVGGLLPGVYVVRIESPGLHPARQSGGLFVGAGGQVTFGFRFQPRMAMEAKSAPSVLYDYYNPDARVVVAPVVFRVHKRH
jgi:hypothetical protein